MNTLRPFLLLFIVVTASCAEAPAEEVLCEGTVLKYVPNYERMQIQAGDHTNEVIIDLVEIRIETPSKYKGMVLRIRHDLRGRAVGQVLAESVGKRVQFSAPRRILANGDANGADLPMSYEFSDFTPMK